MIQLKLLLLAFVSHIFQMQKLKWNVHRVKSRPLKNHANKSSDRSFFSVRCLVVRISWIYDWIEIVFSRRRKFHQVKQCRNSKMCFPYGYYHFPGVVILRFNRHYISFSVSPNGSGFNDRYTCISAPVCMFVQRHAKIHIYLFIYIIYSNSNTTLALCLYNALCKLYTQFV